MKDKLNKRGPTIDDFAIPKNEVDRNFHSGSDAIAINEHGLPIGGSAFMTISKYGLSTDDILHGISPELSV